MTRVAPLLAAAVVALCFTTTPARADKFTPVTDGLTWAEVQVANNFWDARHVPPCPTLNAAWVTDIEVQTGSDSVAPFWGYGSDCAIQLNPDHFERPTHDKRSRPEKRTALVHECVDVVQQVGAARGLSYSPNSGVMDIYSTDTPWDCRVWARQVVERGAALR